MEAKRNIPWTKPEDILIDVTADKLPEFGYPGEYFLVGLSDGSVRAIAKTIDLKTLRKILTRAGRELAGQF